MVAMLKDQVSVRNACTKDLAQIVAMDVAETGIEKADYWRDVFRRYVAGDSGRRHFLVAESLGAVVGFVVGEIRAWEFGSPPSGWVFAIHVDANYRECGLGRDLLGAISLKFKQAGASTVRTMVSRDDALMLSFFRAEGLTAGPYLQLERSLD
jgi:ribosomal protein S18 acetylase RimI-like enzyme